MLFGSANNNDQATPTAAGASDIPMAGIDASQIIFDVGTEDFEQRVMAASMQIPVIVDFWAPWCKPCKQLMPALEKVVMAAGGQVLLAKVNLDDHQQLATALRVQSVPTVFGFFQGQPIDAFTGVQPESKLLEFVQKLITAAKSSQPGAIDIPEALKTAASSLSQGDAQGAHGVYAQILQQDTLNAEAYVGMVRCFIEVKQIEQAEAMVQNAPPEIAKASIFEQAKTALQVAQIKPAGPIDELKSAIESDGNNHQAYIDLAWAQYADGQKQEATETLLRSIELDRDWGEEAARKELLMLFTAIGHSDPVTLKARRKLSSLLFS